MSDVSPLKTLQNFRLRLSRRMRGTVALVIPIFCTTSIFSAWMITRASTRTAERWVEHTESVISESSMLLLGLTTLESRVRRYSIVRQSVNIAAFEQDREAIQELLQAISSLLQDNPAQQQEWQTINEISNRRLELLERLLEQIQNLSSSSSQSPSLSLLEDGRVTMSSLRQALDRFQDEERRLLTLRRQRLNRWLTASTLIGWSLLVGSLLSSLGAVYLFRILETEKTEQTIELDQSQRLLTAIASSVVDSVIIINQLNQVKDFNRSALKMFGYKAKEIIDQPLSEFLSLPEEALVVSWDDETPRSMFETLAVRSNGEKFPVEVSVNQVQSYQRRLLIVRDFSERQAAQKKLEAYAHDLEKLNLSLSVSNQVLNHRNQELDHFAYLAAHDLKAPLRSITSLSEWIEDDLADQLPEDNRRQFQLLRSRARRLEGLIDALAYYSQIGQTVLTAEDITLTDMMQQIIIEQQVPAHIQISIPAELPIIYGNQKYLKEVLSQLLSNSIKFHQGNAGIIELSVTEMDDSWCFIITDDGPGIDPAFHQKIFQVFQTLAPRDQFESKGIGLAIVAKILTTVGGDIQLTSSVGNGASFQFRWPKCLDLTNG